MRRHLLASLLIVALPVSAAEPRRTHDADLGKKTTSATPDKSLAGDLTRKKTDSGQAAPALQYDQFRLDVEVQVASKRREQIESLQQIIGLSKDPKEMPGLLFRMGELYWEESKFFFFEANRKDDEYIQAMNRKDRAGMKRAKQEKAQLLAESKKHSRLAVEQYSEIIQRYKNFERNDEVLFFLGQNLLEMKEERKALIAFRRLIDKYPKSRFLPDAYLAFGEYYFENSKGKKPELEKALEYYRKVEGFPEHQTYAFAIYKQGWCYFNMGDYGRAMDRFKTVVLYGEIAGASALEKDGKGGKKKTLMREARTDYVRAYARSGLPALDARSAFGKVTSNADDRHLMMKQLANLYYEDGKDREAAVSFDSLIKEKPLSPEAPGWQGKIVDCVLRAGNKKMTVVQVRRLVKVMDDVVKSGVLREDKDKKAMEEARELSERTLSNLAVNWHNEAKKTRDDETFRYAHEVYSDYLQLFPDSPKAYDLRFFWSELLNDNLQKYDKAAEQYTLVFVQDIRQVEKKKKPGKWMTNAAYNAVLAWDEVVKQLEESGKLKADAGGGTQKKAIPAPKQSLLEACERYLKHLPKGEKNVEIAFKAANIYYRHNHFDEAIKRFADIALNYPEYKFESGESAAEISANLILDSYNLQGDFAKVNEWARRFYREPKLASGKFKTELKGVIETSAFKLINQLEGKKDYAAAAEAYLAFVSEFPRSDMAEKALYNASIDYHHAKMLDRAIKTRKRLISQYPRSEFVPAAIFANAEGLEAIGDFRDAAEAYEDYAEGYERSKGKAPTRSRRKARSRRAPAKAEGSKQVWEESKAQIALFNAGVFRDGLGDYKRALRNRDKYLELWPEVKDAEAVFLSIADLHEKNGQFSRAMKHLEEYERRYKKNPEKVLNAEARIARIYGAKVGNRRGAERIYGRIWRYYEQLGRRDRSKLDPIALDAIAKAHLMDSQKEFDHYRRLRIKWGRGNAPHIEFKRSLQDKARALEQVQKRYTQTVGFKSAGPAICALDRIGQAYDHMADSLINAPMPRGIPAELQQAIRDEMMNQALPVKEKAAEAFASAVQKGQELDTYNDCYRAALKQLRDNYRPMQFPPMQEDTLALKGEATMAVGADFLSGIQPIPVVTAAQAEKRKAKAAALKEDLADLNGRVGDSLEDDTGPSLPAGNQGAAQPTKSGGGEPEDFL